jgi:hypothetical protein
MAAQLPDTGQLSYGQVTFDKLYHSDVSGACELDRAGRAVKYVKLLFKYDGVISKPLGGPIDNLWASTIQQLTQPGQTFSYLGKGFGGPNGAPFIVNGKGSIKDVAWGPTPKLITFRPMGSGLAAAVQWNLEVTIPQCATAAFINTLLAFNYGTTLSFDSNGYCTYSVTGEFEIAQTYGNTDNIERYRSLSEPLLPVGFQSKRRSFITSDDKRTMRFDYSYEEMAPMGVPFGATDADGNYSVHNQPGHFVVSGKWVASLSASYTIRPDFPRREAWLRYLGLLFSRIISTRAASPAGGVLVNFANVAPARRYVPGVSPAAVLSPQATALANGGTNGGVENTLPAESLRQRILRSLAINQQQNQQQGLPVNSTGIGSVLIQSFGFDEGLYSGSKRVSFDTTWTFMASFQSLLIASGIWVKVNDASGRLYQAAMADIMGYRSWSFYQSFPKQDVIIDACSGINANIAELPNADRVAGLTPPGQRPAMIGATLFGEWQDPDNRTNPDIGATVQGLCDPEWSWMQYENSIATHLDPGLTLHKSMPQSLAQVDSLSTVDSFAANAQAFTGNAINTKSNNTQKDYAVRAKTSTYIVCLQGWGLRAGFQVPVPGLASFGGVTPVPAKQWCSGNRIMANYSGIPVYVNAWKLWYYIPIPPTAQQQPPPNLWQAIGAVADPPTQIPLPVSVPEIDPPPVSTTGDLQVGIVAPGK